MGFWVCTNNGGNYCLNGVEYCSLNYSGLISNSNEGKNYVSFVDSIGNLEQNIKFSGLFISWGYSVIG